MRGYEHPNVWQIGRCYSCNWERGKGKRTQVMYGNICQYCIAYAVGTFWGTNKYR